ncbi:hypothetical protein [Helicobacter sp. 13S00477-4]|uniref:hypothetical protein n=1 Tax=Helicobacter sp. 13S00477-4 TaxID=1905759 RepID=UPI000BA712A5|nr:hypothetical protein [Helicobacter sp. 13S00477-4]PAF51305.1 hypothetical protein BKH44_06265 [Helicobacter sp. 13S00477-4]
MNGKKIKKQTPIVLKKGMKLATWAKDMGLREKDIQLLRNMAIGQTKGKRGRARELKELLIKDDLWREVG